MRTAVLIAAVILAAPVHAVAMSVKAAPDQAPLLFDRVREFNSVIIATTPEGFEKTVKPIPNTNCVYLEVKVERSLKGAPKAGATVRISCHEQLPSLLAARDRKTNRRYLLAVKMSGDWGYLGAAHLYGDLERFFIADDSLEAVATAFIGADKAEPADLLALCLKFLNNPNLSEAGGRHVNDLLARVVQTCNVRDAAARKSAAAALEAVFARMAKGLNIDSAVYVAQMFADVATMNELADFKAAEKAGAVKACDELCRWLKTTLDAPANPAVPDYRMADGMKGAVRLLGLAKCDASADLLVRLANDKRWPDAREAAVSSLATSLGANAEEPLRALLKSFDKPGNERLYNAVIDALTSIGKGDGLEKKAVPLIIPIMH